MKRLFLLVILPTLCAGLWGDEVFTYRMQKEKEVDTLTIAVARTEDGYTVRESQDQGNEERTIETDASYSARTFHFRSVLNGTDYKAERAGNRISVTGMLNNRMLKREFSVNEEPWYQSLEQALGNFSTGAPGSIKFWFLSADDCEIHEMEAASAGTESITAADAVVPARKIKVNLTGFASLFWSAVYWFGAPDNSSLRYETTEGPGGPRLVIQLVSKVSTHE